MLLRLMSEGDEHAFAAIVRFYAPPLAEYVLSVIGSRETTEEIIQDVFTKVWQRRASVGLVREFSNYMFIMTRNAAMNEIVKIAAEVRKKKSFLDWATYTHDDAPVEEEVDYSPLIDQAIEQLPYQQQQVFQLGKRKGLSYKDIARQMQINPSTVKRYMYIASQSVLRFIKSHSMRILFLIMVSLY